jgi:pimeloyl-ACP methyl ester carboxylesterase
MHFSRYGDPSAPTMLLVHGGMLTGSMWQQQVEAFSGMHHVIIPDLPGHGESSDEPIPSYDEIADELANQLQGKRDVTAIGFSIGGQIVLSLMARHPGLVGNAIVISTLTQEVVDSTWRRALNLSPLPVPRQRRSADAFSNEKRSFRLPSALSSSETRTLVVAGEREQREVIVSVAETAAAFKNGRALVVRGTGLDWIIRRPGEFNEAVAAWLAGDTIAPNFQGR